MRNYTSYVGILLNINGYKYRLNSLLYLERLFHEQDRQNFKRMKKNKFTNWIMVNLNSLLIILFGLIALLFPTITLELLAIFFAGFILVGGITLIITSAQVRVINRYWYLHLFEGLIGVILGILILLKPEFTGAILISLIGIWAIFLGMIVLFAYSRKSFMTMNRSIPITLGLLSILFGLLLIIKPFESSTAIVILIGIYAFAYGVFSLLNRKKIL